MTVHVSPPNAVIFKRGQRFGTGAVTIKVVRGIKTTLVARLDGYLPRTFVVDGTYSSVNIALSRAQPVFSSKSKPRKTTPAPADEPLEGASKSADTAAVDTPSDSASASDPEPSKRSPSPSTSTVGSEPITDVDPL